MKVFTSKFGVHDSVFVIQKNGEHDEQFLELVHRNRKPLQ